MARAVPLKHNGLKSLMFEDSRPPTPSGEPRIGSPPPLARLVTRECAVEEVRSCRAQLAKAPLRGRAHSVASRWARQGSHWHVGSGRLTPLPASLGPQPAASADTAPAAAAKSTPGWLRDGRSAGKPRKSARREAV